MTFHSVNRQVNPITTNVGAAALLKRGAAVKGLDCKDIFIADLHKCQREPAAAALTYLVSKGERLNAAWSRLDVLFAVSRVIRKNTHLAFSGAPARFCFISAHDAAEHSGCL